MQTPDALYELLQREHPSSLQHGRDTALRMLEELPRPTRDFVMHDTVDR